MNPILSQPKTHYYHCYYYSYHYDTKFTCFFFLCFILLIFLNISPNFISYHRLYKYDPLSENIPQYKYFKSIMIKYLKLKMIKLSDVG